jgi:hypothetical protein
MLHPPLLREGMRSNKHLPRRDERVCIQKHPNQVAAFPRVRKATHTNTHKLTGSARGHRDPREQTPFHLRKEACFSAVPLSVLSTAISRSKHTNSDGQAAHRMVTVHDASAVCCSC